MTSSYELWDVGAGNIVGSFASEEESLDIVSRLLEAYGRDYAAELELSIRDESGAARMLASGERLLALTEQRVPRAAASAHV